MSEPFQLNPGTIIKRNETKFLSNALGDEMVMMNMDTGDYLGINSVGADIWNLLKQPVALSDLLKNIKTIYDVSEEQCNTDVNLFLKKMMENDMLVIEGA